MSAESAITIDVQIVDWPGDAIRTALAFSMSFVRELCGSQSCAVLHRGAFLATGAPANRLMQLMLRTSVCD
jgi:hypothetical protein